MKNELVKVNDITIEVQPDVEHDWLLSTKDVAEGYGLSESGLRSAKSANIDELEEGKHFINVRNTDVGGKPRVMWTKRGVVRLGFFIKTPMAKESLEALEQELNLNTSDVRELKNQTTPKGVLKYQRFP